MNIFVVSCTSANYVSGKLVGHLSRIETGASLTVPVTVVDDMYNLTTLPPSDRAEDHQRFKLDDFLHPGAIRKVDIERLTRHLDNVESSWVLIDLGPYDRKTYEEFILQLSRYCFINPALRKRNLVFTVPAIHLGFTAQRINESFNSLAVNDQTWAHSNQINALFLLIHLEKALLRIPFLYGAIQRIRGVLLFILRRLARVL